MAELFNVTFHSLDPAPLSRFWATATGYLMVQREPDLFRLAHPGGHGLPHLLFLRGSPSGSGAVHLDLAADDPWTEAQRLIGAGGTLVDAPQTGCARESGRRSARGIDWVVLRDPDGNEFCLGGLPDATTSPE